MRPMEILTTWTCEELLVAYGVYANAHSKEGYDMMSVKDRSKHKLTWLDRWAMPFFTRGQALSISDTVQEEETHAQDLDSIRRVLFG